MQAHPAPLPKIPIRDICDSTALNVAPIAPPALCPRNDRSSSGAPPNSVRMSIAARSITTVDRTCIVNLSMPRSWRIRWAGRITAAPWTAGSAASATKERRPSSLPPRASTRPRLAGTLPGHDERGDTGRVRAGGEDQLMPPEFGIVVLRSRRRRRRPDRLMRILFRRRDRVGSFWPVGSTDMHIYGAQADGGTLRQSARAQIRMPSVNRLLCSIER